MATKFSPSMNGIKIGFQYEGFEFSPDHKYARIRKPRVVIFRDVNIMDHSNILEVSGAVILKQKDHKSNIYRNLSCSGRGKKIIKRMTGEWIELDSTKEVRKLYRVTLTGINWAGGPLEVSGYIAYPRLLPNGSTISTL